MSYTHVVLLNSFHPLNECCVIYIIFYFQEHYSKLKQRVLYYEMLIDKLITKDVKLTACNDDQYFVFEDILHQVLLYTIYYILFDR